VAKECWEEAGIPAALAAAARPAGFVSYVSLSDEGLKPDVLMCFDLQLPPDFVPQAQDGEVGCGGNGAAFFCFACQC
jgi:8-oxo-dGTP pyrophosphatase MutT (NUDIX family)